MVRGGASGSCRSYEIDWLFGRHKAPGNLDKAFRGRRWHPYRQPGMPGRAGQPCGHAAFDPGYRTGRLQNPQQPDQALSPIPGSLAVNVFGLALAPSFLRAICSIASFGIAKVVVNVCSPDTNKNANKLDGRDRTRTNGDEHGCTRKLLFSRVSEHGADGCGRFRTGLNSLVGAPGRNRTSTPCGTRF